MKFESEEYMLEENNTGVTEEQYPYIINGVIAHIDEVKKADKNVALIDIIMDYAFKNGIEIEAVGDAIANDVYFKSFIEKDCELHNVFRNKEPHLEEW